MRLARGFWVACAIAWIGGCTARPAPDDGGSGIDAPHDAGTGTFDAGRESCTDDTECDDGFPCTLDACVVGNVCDHTPLDSACTGEERCVVGRGCVSSVPTECETDADCDDGAYCNGAERCLGPTGDRACLTGTAVDCDDGNACTTDACDDAIDGCRYTTAPGCDAGTSTLDGGTPCESFDVSDYAGTFVVLPTISSACERANWDISDIAFSLSGTSLTGTADSFPLRQMPAPTGADFSITYTQASCSRHTLAATFECGDRFRGNWTVVFEGDCARCGSTMTIPVVGIRR